MLALTNHLFSLANISNLLSFHSSNTNVLPQLENNFQLQEQQRLLPQPIENNQYTAFPPRMHGSTGTVRTRAGDRGQYSQVFERVPTSPRAATLGRVKRSALNGKYPNS